MSKIFVGGYGGTGSRLFQRVMRASGYYLGRTNSALDWMGTNIVSWEASDKWFHNNNPQPLKKVIEQTIGDRESWSLKVGHLMYSFDLIKELYPDALCILTIRHPLDSVTSNYKMHHTHGGYPINAPIKQRLNWYSWAHKLALINTDYVFRLENMVYDPDHTINEIINLTQAKPNPQELLQFKNELIVPKSIGRGQKYYDQFNNDPAVTMFDYQKDLS